MHEPCTRIDLFPEAILLTSLPPRNLSEPLKGEPQTNQRAELMAILRALETANYNGTICIFSDSNYAIRCCTEWVPNWERNKWKTSAGKKVMNQDLIRAILAAEQRLKERGGELKFRWVRGHSDNEGNIAADSLAVMGAEKKAEEIMKEAEAKKMGRSLLQGSAGAPILIEAD
jgi:ribonuclease HI